MRYIWQSEETLQSLQELINEYWREHGETNSISVPGENSNLLIQDVVCEEKHESFDLSDVSP